MLRQPCLAVLQKRDPQPLQALFGGRRAFYLQLMQMEQSEHCCRLWVAQESVFGRVYRNVSR